MNYTGASNIKDLEKRFKRIERKMEKASPVERNRLMKTATSIHDRIQILLHNGGKP